MFDVVEDLEALRKAAKVSQEEMARHLGVSQSQVSRYEQNPDDVPLGILRKWVAICGEVSGAANLAVGQPYQEIEARIRLVQEYAGTEPTAITQEIFRDAPTRAADFVNRIKLDGRKPRIGIFGRFDQGKSRLLNTLMSSNSLPTSYQPATSIICLIKHIDDRPDFIHEDVWIMRDGFNLDQLNDKDHCADHKLYAGGYETLKRYGTHAVESEDSRCFAALVFVRSDLLLACDLIDSPGFGNSDNDHNKAEFAQPLVDIAIYAAAASGFMSKEDFIALSGLLKQLPVVGRDDDLAPLSNLYIVATMASMSSMDQEHILASSSKRAFNHFKELLNQRQGAEVKYSDLRSRFFTFRVEDPTCRQAFESDLSEKLRVLYPQLIRRRLDRSMAELKSGSKAYWDAWAGRLAEALSHRDRAQAALAEHKRQEPARKLKLELKKDGILSIIAGNKEDTRKLITTTLAASISSESIKSVIIERYGDDKKEAQSLCGIYISETCQRELGQFLAERAEGLIPEINEILTDYQVAGQVAGGVAVGSISIPFNAQGVFIGALAATGTAGALAVWAAVATAGSNLGAYLLIPTVVSFLSSIGIGIGGTASAVSMVAAIGGPVTIMLALGLLAGLAAFGLFRPSWQTQLAKKIADTFQEKKFLPTLREHSDKYWDDTRKGFLGAIIQTEKIFEEYIQNLSALANSRTRAQIEHLVKEVEDARDFFAGMPWKPVK